VELTAGALKLSVAAECEAAVARLKLELPELHWLCELASYLLRSQAGAGPSRCSLPGRFISGPERAPRVGSARRLCSRRSHCLESRLS